MIFPQWSLHYFPLPGGPQYASLFRARAHDTSQQGGLSDEGHQRMRQLEVSLDQCWDLLRQRRALRSAHLNPDEAKLRNADIVEHYKQ